MPASDPVRTGISGLDVILSDGIPRGNIVLVEGAVGTGKTTFGVEFVYRGASLFDEPGLIVLFEVSPARLVHDAASRLRARCRHNGARRAVRESRDRDRQTHE